MRTASILLALAVVLSFVSEAAAAVKTIRYAIEAGDYIFGLVEIYNDVDRTSVTMLFLGPVGTHQVPFSATQGLVGFCVFLALLVIVPVVKKVRSNRRQPKQL
jgi:hypothetical protein